ncbi:uncharacterized protein LY89DRAFT_783330 [Mollisia scopiformis]|uniref:SnoaL-like domain-containing protein n=1 Tax=Mollisia scopiformis TaxID=149040 RepID=A0A194X4M8_MOLSC|nr:uncharacterized protein LY89DRAFT_783330 [Mollisia scopiformis]KUJ15121.1 hypothetical protein LY89DRAFT_783330 [Mollisia scopiformis]
MSFQLTPEYIYAFLGPAAQGEWTPFLDGLDPDVNWMIGDPTFNEQHRTGTYNVKTWREIVNKPLIARLASPLTMKIESLDIIGLKAIVEASGSATQKNGKQYNNRYCWILIFDGKTGKVVTIREYINTAMLKEVMETNEI